MVADLVRDDVSLREVARRMEAGLQLIKELQIDVDVLIRRAVERPGRCRSKPTTGLAGVGE